MLARLRFDGLVGGDYEQQQIYAGGACEHVADEALVPRDVYKTEAHAAVFHKCEAEVNGDAAALFLFEAVGVRAGEGLDERRLAVIDMAGRADDYAF